MTLSSLHELVFKAVSPSVHTRGSKPPWAVRTVYTGRGLPTRCAVQAAADLPTPCLREGRESWPQQGSKGCASCTVGVRPAARGACCGRLHRGEAHCCSGVLCRLDNMGADLLSAGSVWPSPLAHRHVKDVNRDGMGLPGPTCISFGAQFLLQGCTPYPMDACALSSCSALHAHARCHEGELT